VNGVHQGCAVAILMIELIQICTGEHEGCYLTIIEADAGQIAAAGQQIGTQEDIRSLILLDGDHLLDCKKLIFGRRCGRRRGSSAALAGVCSPLAVRPPR